MARHTNSQTASLTSTALLACCTLTTLLGSSASAATLQVPAGFATIQSAINAAAPGDVVLVQPGVYLERIDFLGKEITVKSTDPDNPALTVIDADYLGTAVTIDGGVGPDAKLVGFTIREGSDTSGGGLDIAGSPTIRSCVVTLCDATVGGGAYVDGNASFIDCRFLENDATSGGALSITGNATVERCLFDGNHATGGGAVSLDGFSTFADCDFDNNDATVASSMQVADGTAVIDRCRFGDSDSLAIQVLSNLVVTNSLFTDSGVAIESVATLGPVVLSVLNCTFHNEGTAGIRINGNGFATAAVVSNSIIRSNTESIALIGSGVGGGFLTVSRSNIEGGWAGTGNIDVDPQFVDAAAGNFRLDRGSPCIDAGGNAILPAYATADLDGTTRFVNDVAVLDTGAGTSPIVDMGCFETPCTVRYVRQSATGAGTGLSWADAYVDLQDALDDAAVGGIDYVLVAEGTYQPDRGTNNRSLSFELVSGTQVIGGFAGGELDVSEADPAVHQTTLSGAIGGGGSADNSYHVVRATNVDATGGLSGFIIQKGNANAAAGLDRFGGGLFIDGGAPVVRECWIRQNESLDGGAGLFAIGSDLTVRECRANLNVTAGTGSAMLFSSGAPSLLNSLIHGNDSGSNGAVGLIAAANGLLVNLTIADNVSTGGFAGGLYIAPPATGVVRNSLLWKNQGTAVPVEIRQVNALGVLDIAACSVLGWSGALGGAGNDGNDPAFLDPMGPDLTRGTADDNYRLKVTSNAIDNASANWLPMGQYPTDLDGADRFVDDPASVNAGIGAVSYLDRGCFEFQPALCDSDLNADGKTDGADLAILLGAWGGNGAADLDNSGLVDAADLAIMLGGFGPC